uniref:Seipin n=1 Tax=Attheya septentrionalis TaxID=420275 RepID=A0A7S2XTB1_9STRA|mmetsp:Transcript_6654/g.11996  ORF Transcript_6654/g.11996 Transcript_6654/m.11996 type:complete len:554 (+) Transcript_6654:109-1770(+)
MESVEQIGALLMQAASTALVNAAQDARLHGEEARERFVEAASDSFIGLVPLIKRALLVCSVVSGLVISSTLTYTLAYQLAMPARFATVPLFFDYLSPPNNNCIQPPDPSENGNMERSCNIGNRDVSYPTAVVDLGSRHTQWTPYVDEVIPAAPVISFPHTGILKAHRRHFIHVQLTLPESQVNHNVGVFMVETELADSKGMVLAKSKRPAFLPYESPVISTFKKLVFLIPFLLGAFLEARSVVIPCLDHYVESPKQPLTSITVRLMVSQATRFPETTQAIQVLHAELRIGKELNMLQRILKEWFYTCAGTGISCILLWQLLVLWVIHIGIQHVRARHQGMEEQDLGGGASVLDSENFGSVASENDFGSITSEPDWESLEDLPKYESEAGQTDTELYDDDDVLNEDYKINVDERKNQATKSAQKGGEHRNNSVSATEKNAGIKTQNGEKQETPKKEIIVCPICTKTVNEGDERKSRAFTNKRALEDHMKTKHDGDKKQDESDASSIRLQQKRKTKVPLQKPRMTKEAEDELAQRVMKGATGPFEIFTDLDDPDI